MFFINTRSGFILFRRFPLAQCLSANHKHRMCHITQSQTRLDDITMTWFVIDCDPTIHSGIRSKNILTMITFAFGVPVRIGKSIAIKKLTINKIALSTKYSLELFAG
jgi:hypothetical protein